MFTGIIEEMGHIKRLKQAGKSLAITVGAKKILEDVHIGDSIAVNGVCLTVETFTSSEFTAYVMAESVKMTTLSNLSIGSAVNLERAMAADGRFGGHIVAGHVDGKGHIIGITPVDESIVFRIGTSEDVLDYVIYKGSIAVDGASLTVSAVGDGYFEISIIPHTLQETLLGQAKVGTEVNLETDIFGRYVAHFMTRKPALPKEKGVKSSVTMDSLIKHGFI